MVGLLCSRAELWGQEDDPASFIGLTLAELMGVLGVPQSVYPVRGLETWQDDVVFVYNEGDFYIIKDRVWQMGLKSAYRIRVGDPRAVVLLVLGDSAEDQGDYISYAMPSRGWPLTFRCNFDTAGRVSAMFIFRPDI